MPRRPLALLIAVFLIAACGGDDDGDTASTNPLAPTGTAALTAICDAAQAAPADAERAFHSIHDDLHDIGDALTEVDRSAGGGFLRAKSAVEADLSGDAAADKLSADLDALAGELTKALETLDIDAPDC